MEVTIKEWHWSPRSPKHTVKLEPIADRYSPTWRVRHGEQVIGYIERSSRLGGRQMSSGIYVTGPVEYPDWRFSETPDIPSRGSSTSTRHEAIRRLLTRAGIIK